MRHPSLDQAGDDLAAADLMIPKWPVSALRLNHRLIGNLEKSLLDIQHARVAMRANVYTYRASSARVLAAADAALAKIEEDLKQALLPF